MSVSVWWSNLGAYALQAALLIAVGLGLPRLVALRRPDVRLRYWQGLLVLTLLLPLIQPWQREAAVAEGRAAIGLRHELAGLVQETGIGSAELLGWTLALGVAVAVARLGWLGVGLRTLARYRRGAAALCPVSEAVRGIRDRLATGAEILVSDRIAVPLTFGWRRPAILVPRSFLELGPEAQRGIVCHELLHVQRRDWPAAVGEEVLKSLLWFHPGVWVLLARIRLSREQIVDCEVVRLTREKRAYLEALWSLAPGRRPGVAVAGLAFLRRSQLFHRVVLMTREAPTSGRRPVAAVLLLTALLALTAIAGANFFPLTASPESVAPTVSAPPAAAAPAPPPVAEPAARAEPAAEPRSLTPDVVAPRAVSKVRPQYPEAARKERVQGVVVLQMVIDVDGRVRGGEVLRSARADLDSAAMAAVRQWRFEPATLGGTPVAVYYNLTVNFQLA